MSAKPVSSPQENEETPRGSLQSYAWGFIYSIVLTAIPFLIVIKEQLTGWALTYTLLGFAVVQLLVQLVLFLHLGQESKPRWNTIAFLFAALVVLIVVIGSLWIMANLDYNVMTPAETDQYISEEELIKP
jgi:cytochrome o ubiquinol oxidase operon protein cyoD